MTDDGHKLEPPALTADDFLRVPDAHFERKNVALVTGGGSGIGRATSVALACNDLTVAAVDIDADGLETTVDVAASLDATGQVVPVEADLTDDAAVEAAVEEAASLGTVRYAANIAGMQHIASLADFPMETYDFMHDVMLRSPFLLSKLVIPHVEATDDGVGAIGNMSSIHGHYATKDKPAYVTLKHGLTGLTRVIASEGSGTLRGFAVSVGYVLTPLMADQIADTAEKRGISEQAVVEDVMLGEARTREMMTPAEVANLFVFGFSGHAKHLNGGDLLFDGGYVNTYE